MSYSNYLQSEHWKSIRSKKLDKSPVCQICDSSTGLNVHHKYYKDTSGKSILNQEKIEDLITLCKSCHRLIHYYFGIEVKKINKKILRIRQIMKVGGNKKKAFWLVATNGMWEAVYPKMKEKTSSCEVGYPLRLNVPLN